MSTIVVNLIFAFILAKSIFIFFGWITKYDEDLLYRKNIDIIIDKFDKKSVYCALVEFVSLLSRKIQLLFNNKKVKYLYVPTGIYFLNFLIYYYTTFYILKSNGVNVHDYHYEVFTKNFPGCYVIYYPVIGLFVAPIFLTLISILSIVVTIKLLGKASIVKDKARFFFLLTLDVILCLFFCIAIRRYSFFVEGFCRGIGTIVDCNIYLDKHVIFLNSAFEVARWLLISFGSEKVYLLFGLTSYLPTLLYLIVIIPIVVMVIWPRAITRVLFLVTTDNKPIMSQLGDFFGLLAAMFSVLTDYLIR